MNQAIKECFQQDRPVTIINTTEADFDKSGYYASLLFQEICRALCVYKVADFLESVLRRGEK